MENKRLWYVAGGVVVLVVLAVVLRGTKEGWPELYPSATPTPSSSVSATPKASAPKAGATAMPKSYTDAVVQYANQRIQFDMYCQATPVNSTYKNGSSIMLDNRSGDARIISLNGVQYRLAGYGWTIVTLSYKTLPMTVAVDCGAARNVSKILVQK